MAINLTKGQKIDLSKKDNSGVSKGLTKFCVGVNWGAIEGSYVQEVTKGGFLGIGGKKVRETKKFKEAVDLDASCCLFNNTELVDVVSFQQLISKDGAVVHSGDDREGDMDGDDGLDNEIISVDLRNIDNGTNRIVFFLNSYKKQDFASVPFSSIRLYEGTPEKVNQIFATYDVSSDSSYKGFISMVMGSIIKSNGMWNFKAIGDPLVSKDLDETVSLIKLNYSN